MHHVSFLWHLKVLSAWRIHSNEVKVEVWEFVVLLLFTLAAPNRLHLETENAVFLEQVLYEVYKWFLWCHGETHTVVKNELLWFVRKLRVLTIENIIWVDSPIHLVLWLFAPEDVLLCESLFSVLSIVNSTKEHLAWNVDIVRKVETEDWVKVFIELSTMFELSNKAWDSWNKWLFEIFLLGWCWSQPNKTWTFQSFYISSLDHRQETEFVQAVLAVTAETSSVLRWVSKDFALTILKELSCLSIVLEVLGLCLFIFFILRTVLFCTFFWEKPSPCRPCIKDNRHLLWRSSKPKVSFVSHVHQVFHVNGFDVLLEQAKFMIIIRHHLV